ncbi:condensin subunit Smc [Anseongella ginsenosidimutans]|uniref:Chromosome partition protein Smc n=1 Tax=Anseongella ginsenosidimutans TaxID=496056 RepID=A0A4R3KW44_9SPHI|nr:chromosome segregation protein SMC [Anseongella ginsenosidimutans]QEC53290.1 chromosome segregation protein SMC [Anseongella ginsenosidimutans]TCS88161.1 condensin subunit Smc [Anseongella ginsenosidimutans]
MKLTSLEIKGFKSFGDKVIINFDVGVTSIVGPNGCGKSNVVDAIRWVLGEQSTRMLRSEKMENVIFNGTSSRKPSNLAEVSLSFDNTRNVLPTEFSQVTITRKLYRSGDSEYRLNDVQCRLKDITDLFLDTGIGPDSYSIIELKMIEEILNNKDNSRRALFEEASGISKYKVRKKQTLNKLKDTESDLSRVEDLLFEIEKNLKTLENQAKKAERFYRLKDQYKETSVALASFRIHAFRQSLEELQKQEQQQQDELLRLQTESQKLEAVLQEEKRLSLQKEKNLSVQQKATNEYVASIRQYESEKKLKNEQLKFRQEKESRLLAELSSDKLWMERSRENIIQLETGRETESNLLAAAEQQLSVLKARLEALREDHRESRIRLEEAGTEAKRLQEEAYQAEKEKDILTIQAQTLEQELQRTTSDAREKEDELQGFSASISRLDKLVREREQLLQEALETEENLVARLLQTEEEIRETKEKTAVSGRLRDAKQNEYHLTKSLVDNLEGYPESIKFLRKNAGWAKKAPLLSDILFCREAYRIAIENYLEPYMNYYVVESYKEAMQAISLLSDASRGRANFFVLEAFKEYEALPPVEIKDLLPALEIIESEEKYQPLCHYLLQGVYLLSKEKEAGFDPEAYPVTVLSESGKYAKGKFSISGGFVGLFEGKRIGRARNLEVLQKEIKKLDTQLEELASKTGELEQQYIRLKESTKKKEIADLRTELSRYSNELLTLQTKESQYREFIGSSALRKEDIVQKLSQYRDSLAELQPRLQVLEEEKLQAGSRQLRAQEDFKEVSDKVNAVSGEFNQQNIQFHQQKNKLDGLLKDLDYKQADVERYQERIEKNTAELDSTRKGIAELLQMEDGADEDLQSMYSQKEEMEKGLREAEEDHYATKGNISQVEEQLSLLRRRKEQADFLSSELKDKKTQLKIDLNSLKERLSVNFNIDIEDLLEQEETPQGDEGELAAKAEKLKNQLDNFGAINPMAMEAFNEMNERYQFISREKNDLLEAKASLLSTIGEIDDTARHQFLAAFNQIKENFRNVFRSLFNQEDSCDLFLVKPDEPLESEIEIVARPKGKKPLSINQLSGGEKTLTATAILFSLYLLKPAPFCIFDEVDAPLDDTNIDKFNNIIREFSKDSQFIVVTHNKRTIASTDVIYGVTMVEQGISRVVPVDLRGLETAAAV